ncbi:MAG: DUF4430 domain-containing protein [Nanoarchaeota archaeon]|nr:DUF4430 domain-containing protein [Nanoarchaeota archaeon]
MNTKKLLSIFAIILILSLAAYLSQERSKVSTEISYSGPGNVLELLREEHDVVTKNTKWGPYVECIDGICANTTHFWLYYVNGELAPISAHLYNATENDTIVWKFTSNNPF